MSIHEWTRGAQSVTKSRHPQGPARPHPIMLLCSLQNEVATQMLQVEQVSPLRTCFPDLPVLAQISYFEGMASFCLQTAASMDFLTCVPNPGYETIVAQSVGSSATVKQSVHANTLGASAACNFKIVMQMLLLLKKMQRTGHSVRRAPVAAW